VDLLRQTAELVDAAVFEDEPRPGHQVTNRFRYAGFTGAGCCRYPRGNVNGNAADLLALQLNLTSVDAATQQYPERRNHVGNCRGTANRPRRTVKDADKAVPAVANLPAAKPPDLVARRIVVPIEQDTPIAIPHLSHPFRRVDDIGDEDGDEDSVVIHFIGHKSQRGMGTRLTHPYRPISQQRPQCCERAAKRPVPQPVEPCRAGSDACDADVWL